MVWEFDDFPDIDAVLTQGTVIFVLDGIAVRKNDKNGFFNMEGVETTPVRLPISILYRLR